MFCPHCGVQNQEADAKFCGSCGKALQQYNSPLTVTNLNENSSQRNFKGRECKMVEYEVRRISDWQTISNVIWIVIGIIQVFVGFIMIMFRMIPYACCFIIIGSYNIAMACKKWNLPKRILNKDADIPWHYEPIMARIISAAVNTLLAAVFGALLSILDFYIRSLVLKDWKLFTTKVAEA